MRVFLDDERATPEGWVRVYWPDEAIALLKSGTVQEISLDHDLGDDARGTGYDVVLWIESEVALHSFTPPKIIVHSANTSAREKMLAGISAIARLSEQNSLLDFPEELISTLRHARHLVVFTGSGVSAESGIPTFRDAMTGLWENFDVEMLATRQAFRRDPAQVWGWYEWRRKLVMQAQPNSAHLAIAKLAELVPQLTVITQNVDDLHERAGSTGVIHLHGSFFTARCFACDRPFTLPPDESDEPDCGRQLEPPRCGHCNGRIRPGVVWFGERLSKTDFAKARKAVRKCDVLISVGTSSEVFPAAGLPFEAAKNRAVVIQVNPSTTKLDKVARFNLRGAAGDVMARIVRAAWPDRGSS